MMSRRLMLFPTIILSGCQGVETRPDIDVLYTDAVVWTGQEGEPPVSGVVGVKGDRIAFVGDALPSGYDVGRTVDLDGAFVMPGLQDNHVHFMEGGAALASVDLRNVATPDAFVEAIGDHARTLAPGEWVLNGNWDETLWAQSHPDAGLPRADWIDATTPDTPVFVIRLDGHSALANSAALRAAGITADTPDPRGGIILRDADGTPTGLLKNAAMELVLAVIPAPSDDVLMRQFQLAQDHALSLGLTKVHAVTAYPTETTMLDIFQTARERDLMLLRAQVSTPLDSWADMARASESGTGDDVLRWGGVKGLADGSLGSRTAWFHQPYSDDPDAIGLPATEPDDLARWMGEASAAGLELSIHVIGDKAVDLAIDELEALGSPAKRHRLEHVQHPSAEAIERIAARGIIASMHPYHAVDDGRWASERIGSDRLATAYPFGSLIRAGAPVSFGSDWPVAPLSPLLGVEAAVTRATLDGKNPGGWVADERISVEQALRAYTYGNAYSFNEEHEAGTIEPGKRADMTVLAQNPFDVAPQDIGEITVLRTVIGGETRFEITR